MENITEGYTFGVNGEYYQKLYFINNHNWTKIIYNVPI